MYKNPQKTIKEPIEFEGVGLHNGIKVNLCLKPAEANSGVKFKRTDIDSSKNIIEASYKNVSSSALCTKIENSQGVSVSTIEHLMAAFYGEEIDNVIVEIDAPEILPQSPAIEILSTLVLPHSSCTGSQYLCRSYQRCSQPNCLVI